MIDILLATYNGEEYLKDLLDSLEKQTYKAWRLVVSDDGSTDSTVEILKKYQDMSEHEVEIHVNDHPFGSAKKNFFHLLQFSKSEYAMFCDQDDVWIDEKIKCSMEVMEETEKEYGKGEPVMVHTDLAVVDEHLKFIDNSFYQYSRYNLNFSLGQLLILNTNVGCTILMNRKLISMARKKCNVDKVLMHDSWVALIATTFGKSEFVDKPLVLYRQHTDNSVGAPNAKSWKYKIKRFFNSHLIRSSDMGHIVEADEFYKTFEEELDGNKYKQLLASYRSLINQSRIQYRRVCIKYKILKYPMSRAVAQLLYCHK